MIRTQIGQSILQPASIQTRGGTERRQNFVPIPAVSPQPLPRPMAERYPAMRK